MAQLAIKGHATRGKEVIEILEMLGGKTLIKLSGDLKYYCYYINSEGFINYKRRSVFNNDRVYSLEEFLERFPYKVGDKVLYKTYGIYSTIKTMKWNAEKEQVFYRLYSKNFFVATVDELKPCKEETMEEQKAIPPYMDYDVRTEHSMEEISKISEDHYVYDKLDLTQEPAADEVEVILGDYEFVFKNGKTYFVKKKPKYPKTYEECCKIVNANPCVRLVYDLSDGQKYSYDVDNLQHYENIRKLLICRDAYWKMAGEQMGLDKPWKPDMSKDEFSYAISYQYGHIQKNEIRYKNTILAFPTEEMRDAFKENFDGDIDACKDFL